MKTIKMMASVLILLYSMSINAQDLKPSEVPTSFTEGLLKAYPKATNIEWEKNGTDYKVEFEVDNLDHEIWFNKNGERVRLEQHIVTTALPKNIADIIKRDYPEYKIDSVEKTEKNGVITYEVELEKSWDHDQKIVFGLTGKVLSVTRD